MHLVIQALQQQLLGATGRARDIYFGGSHVYSAHHFPATGALWRRSPQFVITVSTHATEKLPHHVTSGLGLPVELLMAETVSTPHIILKSAFLPIKPKDQLAFVVEARALPVNQLLREGLPGIAEGLP